MKSLLFSSLLLLYALVQADLAAAQPPDWSSGKKNHWAWKVPTRPAVPVVKNNAWVRNPIDAFILAKLEAAGLQARRPASREQLIRRVTFDLIGLPPTPAEIDAFVNDRAADAWEKVVDRLLASPHYGERWGRHWLDLARYRREQRLRVRRSRGPTPGATAITSSRVQRRQAVRPLHQGAARRRRAVSRTIRQALIATGFNLLGPDMTDAASQLQRRQNTLDDMTDTTGLVFLGLTVGCARCHDHKFEPIPQADYFRLQAFFAPAEFRRDLPVADAARRRRYDKQMTVYQDLDRSRPQIEPRRALEEPLSPEAVRGEASPSCPRPPRLAHRHSGSTTQRRHKGTGRRARCVARSCSAKEVTAAMTEGRASPTGALAARAEEVRRAKSRRRCRRRWACKRPAKRPKTFVLRRGELKQPRRRGAARVGSRSCRRAIAPSAGRSRRRRRRPPAAAPRWRTGSPSPTIRSPRGSWSIASGSTTSAAASSPRRATSACAAQPPTHPELLDWLATEFVARGWSIKQMHRS